MTTSTRTTPGGSRTPSTRQGADPRGDSTGSSDPDSFGVHLPRPNTAGYAYDSKPVLQAAKTLKVPGDTVLTIHALVDMKTATAKMRRALFHVDTL